MKETTVRFSLLQLTLILGNVLCFNESGLFYNKAAVLIYRMDLRITDIMSYLWAILLLVRSRKFYFIPHNHLLLGSKYFKCTVFIHAAKKKLQWDKNKATRFKWYDP